MGRFAAVLALIAIMVGIAAATASAHNTTWYWSERFASNFLNQKDFCFNDGSCRDIDVSLCAGRKTDANGRKEWIWNNTRTIKLYKHLWCSFRFTNGAIWTALVHVTGEKTWVSDHMKLERPATR
jgi:hypothetical protein